MKKESMVGRRIYAFIIDFLLFVVIAFFVGALVVNPIMEATTDVKETIATYSENEKRYEDLQDEYNIYIYDENNKRVYNDDVSESTKEAFLNDTRVVELKNTLYEQQKDVLSYGCWMVTSTILIAGILVFTVMPLCLQKGRTLGKLIAKLYIVDMKDNYAKWYIVIARSLLSIIMNLLLGLISLAVFPLVNLVVSICTKENQTLYDLICRTKVVNGKVPVEISTATANIE